MLNSQRRFCRYFRNKWKIEFPTCCWIFSSKYLTIVAKIRRMRFVRFPFFGFFSCCLGTVLPMAMSSLKSKDDLRILFLITWLEIFCPYFEQKLPGSLQGFCLCSCIVNLYEQANRLHGNHYYRCHHGLVPLGGCHGCKLLCYNISAVIFEDVVRSWRQLFPTQIFSIGQVVMLVGRQVSFKPTPSSSQLEWSPNARGTMRLSAAWIPFESPLFWVIAYLKLFTKWLITFWDGGEQLSNFAFSLRLYKRVVRDLFMCIMSLNFSTQ